MNRKPQTEVPVHTLERPLTQPWTDRDACILHWTEMVARAESRIAETGHPETTVRWQATLDRAKLCLAEAQATPENPADA